MSRSYADYHTESEERKFAHSIVGYTWSSNLNQRTLPESIGGQTREAKYGDKKLAGTAEISKPFRIARLTHQLSIDDQSTVGVTDVIPVVDIH